MKRTAILLYGVASYFAFFATILYAIGFVGNIWVPKAIDSAPTAGFAVALLTNLGLLALFAIQHSSMARPAFKRAWTRIIPPAAERSTYVLFSSVALMILFAFWQPMGGVIWHFEDSLVQAICYTLFGLGWVTVFASSFLINHFDLFGLRQVWLHFRRRPYTHLPFATPGLYRLVRHPLYCGFLLAFWFTPTLTVAHLLFALMITAYILVGTQLEERDPKGGTPAVSAIPVRGADADSSSAGGASLDSSGIAGMSAGRWARSVDRLRCPRLWNAGAAPIMCPVHDGSGAGTHPLGERFQTTPALAPRGRQILRLRRSSGRILAPCRSVTLRRTGLRADRSDSGRRPECWRRADRPGAGFGR